MKVLTLICLSVLMSSSFAQNNYVPLKKARKNAEYIFVESPGQVAKLMRRIPRYPLCSGISIDTRGMSKAAISEFLLFLRTQPDVTTLQMRYAHGDSVNFNLLAQLTRIENLCLRNEDCSYGQVGQLASLRRLYKLSLYIDSIGQLPLSVCQLGSIGEIDLLADIYNPALSTDLHFYYPLNDSLDNFIELNSYVDGIDLSNDSVKRMLFAMWPNVVEKKNGWVGVTSVSDRNIFSSPDPAMDYKSNVNLKPVVKDIKPVFETSHINPVIENTLIFDDKTILNIPADAFVTKSGEPVEGDLQILYRAVRTPSDMLASGVTMFYDTAGQKEMFKTNGMFEIRAFANSEELMLKKGKEIGVDFKANSDSGSFNLYTLNDTNGKWQYAQNLFMVPDYSYISTFKVMKDRTEFADRYTDLSYHYVLPKDIYTGVQVPHLTTSRHKAHEIFKMNVTKTNRKMRPTRSLFRLKIDYEISDSKKGKVLFYLLNDNQNLTTATINYFPELRPFNGFAFEFDGELKTSEFTALYKKGKCYTDCRIYYEINSTNAIIELKTKQGFIQIPVKATVTNIKGKERPNAGLRRAYLKYLRLLKIKETKFNLTVHKVLRSNYNCDSNIYYTFAENKTSKGNRNTYRLNISVLGFFNCDQLYRIKEPMMVMNTRFVCSDTLLTGLGNAYVVDNDAKGTYTFNPASLMLSYENMGGLIINNDKGEVYTCTGTDFRNQVTKAKQLDAQVIKVVRMPKVENAEKLVNSLD